MNELDEAAVAFFHAVRNTGVEYFGHVNFIFTINVETRSPPEDKEAALKFNDAIQAALTKATTEPSTIERTSLQ